MEADMERALLLSPHLKLNDSCICRFWSKMTLFHWDIKYVRAAVAYWFLGLCNNYGYVVMLTAAADIIGENKGTTNNDRKCTYMSTGIILLADIIPGLCSKTLAPFLPFFVNVRVTVCVLASVAGFLLEAFSPNIAVALVGVAITSFGSGLGEVTLLQYSSYQDKRVISAWASGTGAAGVIGSLSYVVLQNLGLKWTMLTLLVVPLIMAVSFWIVLPKGNDQTEEVQKQVNDEEVQNPKLAFRKKLQQLPLLLKYMIPFFLVYFFEYFINQGTFELIRIPNNTIKAEDQYKWLQVCYQVGVFISRSSVNLFRIPWLNVLCFLQFLNLVLYTTEAMFFYIPSFWIMVGLTVYEGLLGGLAYVNTYYRISSEVPEEKLQFSMAITGFADTLGITVAAITAIYAHNGICGMPLPDNAIIA